MYKYQIVASASLCCCCYTLFVVVGNSAAAAVRFSVCWFCRVTMRLSLFRCTCSQWFCCVSPRHARWTEKSLFSCSVARLKKKVYFSHFIRFYCKGHLYAHTFKAIHSNTVLASITRNRAFMEYLNVHLVGYIFSFFLSSLYLSLFLHSFSHSISFLHQINFGFYFALAWKLHENENLKKAIINFLKKNIYKLYIQRISVVDKWTHWFVWYTVYCEYCIMYFSSLCDCELFQ